MNILSRQTGTTLVELVGAMAIASVISLGASAALFQILVTADGGVERLMALNDIENAARWIARDVRMSDVTDLTDGAPAVNAIALQWTDSEGGGQVSHTTSYSLSGSDLVRNFDGAITTVARHVANVGFSLNGRLLSIQIEELPAGGDAPLEKTYDVLMRPTN